MRSRYLKRIRTAAALLGAAAIAIIAWDAVGEFGGGSDEKAMVQLEDAVRRAAVSCYASEGRYSARLDYLVDRYGLQLDDRFAVHYEVFASNLAPDVTVVTMPSQEEIWGLKK